MNSHLRPVERTCSRNRQWKRYRRGAAFLMLVVVVLLVVIAATKTLVTSEVANRRNEVSQLRVETLAAAIDTTVTSNLLSGSAAIRYPIHPDSATNIPQWIEVSAKDQQITAKWFAGDRLLDEVVRQVDPAVNPSDSETGEASETD